jgi:hypothetical protein
MKAIKWIAVLPLSIAALFTANIVWVLVYRFSFHYYGEPDSWVNLIFAEIMSSLVSGAAFIYSGVSIAPSYKKEVAFFLTVFISVITGMTFFFVDSYISNVGLLALLIGAVVSCLDVNKKESTPL